MKVKIPPRKVFQYKKADYEGMKKELRAFIHEFQQKAESEDSQYLWTTFKKKTISLMEKFIPSKMLRGNKPQKPWVTREVKCLRRKQKVLFKRQHKTGAAKDIRHYRETKARLQKAENHPTGGILRILLGSETQTRNIIQSKSDSSTSSSHFGETIAALHPSRKREDCMMIQKIRLTS